MIEWISVKDRLPEKAYADDILFFVKTQGPKLGQFIGIFKEPTFEDYSNEEYFTMTHRTWPVTHWAEINPPEI